MIFKNAKIFIDVLMFLTTQREERKPLDHAVNLAESDIEEIKRIRWYHTISLGRYVTAGHAPICVQQWKSKAIPEDLSGMSVLDVGAWDGYYSFLAEARGARRVLAIDAFQGSDNTDRGFRLAKRVLGSKVEHRFHSVYDLDKLGERFDLVLFLGVYYHLVDPIMALQRIYDALKEGGILVLEGAVMPGRKPVLRALRRGDGFAPTDYCIATVPWIRLMTQHIGYQNFELVSVDPVIYWKRVPPLVAWKLGLAFGPFFKLKHRALIRARRGLKK